LVAPLPGSKEFDSLTAFKTDIGEWPRTNRIKLRGLTVSKSPQKELAIAIEQKCLSKIPDQANGVLLDEILIDAVAHTLAAKDLEPCLRMLTLRTLILMGTELSPTFRTDKVKSLLVSLDDGKGGIPDILREELGLFIAPDRDIDPAYIKVRQISERLLARAEQMMEQLRRDAMETRKLLTSPAAPVLRCIGRLGRDTSGSVTFVPSPKGKVSPGEDLQIIEATGTVRVIGKCGPDGRTAIEGRSLVAGVPVFVLEKRGSL